MSNYTPSGYPDSGNRWISSLLDAEFAAVAVAISSKQDTTNANAIYGTDGGLVNAYTLTPTPALGAYYNDLIVVFTPMATNTGATTLNVSSLGVKALTTVNGSALSATDLLIGQPYMAAYNGTQFFLLGGNDRAARAGDTYTGTHNFTTATALSVATKAAGNNSTHVASTAYVDNAFTNSISATSSTNVSFGSGSKTLTVELSKSFVTGMNVIVANTADPVKYMRGIVTSYDSLTGAFVFVSDSGFTGAGSSATWTISLAGAPGANGISGLQYVNATATLVSGMSYHIDTTAGAFTTHMPLSPAVGALVSVNDPLASWSTNTATLGRNGSNFLDQYNTPLAEDFELNAAGIQITFIYTATGWKAI